MNLNKFFEFFTPAPWNKFRHSFIKKIVYNCQSTNTLYPFDFYKHYWLLKIS